MNLFSVLQSSNSCKQIVGKNFLNQPQTTNSSESINADVESARNYQNCVATTLNHANDLKTPSAISISSPQQSVTTTEGHSVSSKHISDTNTCKSIFVTPIKRNLAEASKSNSAQDNVLNLNSVSPVTNPQTSTPVNNRKNSAQRKRVELIRCSPSQGGSINPEFKESLEHEKVNNLIDAGSISFDNASFPSLGGNSTNTVNGSNFSPSVNKSEQSDLFNSNFSRKSNVSVSNRVPQSPVSPLYSNSISMLSPINVKSPQYRHNDSPTNSIYYPQNSASTPERSSNNLSKSSKTTPRHSFNLSDFIVTETRSSKKGSGRKNSNKVLSRNEEQKEIDQQSLLSDTSTHSEKNTRRRKVNPTRLNITDEKGNFTRSLVH